jgi:hypothetical protein
MTEQKVQIVDSGIWAIVLMLFFITILLIDIGGDIHSIATSPASSCQVVTH